MCLNVVITSYDGRLQILRLSKLESLMLNIQNWHCEFTFTNKSAAYSAVLKIVAQLRADTQFILISLEENGFYSYVNMDTEIHTGTRMSTFL